MTKAARLLQRGSLHAEMAWKIPRAWAEQSGRPPAVFRNTKEAFHFMFEHDPQHGTRNTVSYGMQGAENVLRQMKGEGNQFTGRSHWAAAEGMAARQKQFRNKALLGAAKAPFKAAAALGGIRVPAGRSLTGRTMTRPLAQAAAMGLGKGIARLALSPLTAGLAVGGIALAAGHAALKGAHALTGRQGAIIPGGMVGRQLHPTLQLAGGAGMIGVPVAQGAHEEARHHMSRGSQWQVTTGAGGLPEMERSDFLGATGSMTMGMSAGSGPSSPFAGIDLRRQAPLLADDAVLMASRLLLRH